jgi:hypothetical protein
MPHTSRRKTLYDAYRFPGFTPVQELRGVFGDRFARVIRLNRRSKKRFAGLVGLSIEVGTTSAPVRFGISRAGTTGSTSKWIYAESTVGSAEA